MFLDQKGFSLISVVIASTLMSVIGLGISNMIVSNSKTISYLEDKSAALDLKNLITLQLSDMDSCKNSFGTIDLSSNDLSVSSIKTKENEMSFSAASVYDRLSIGSMRVDNVNLPIALSSTGVVNLVIPINRDRNDTRVLSSLRVPIQVTTTSVAPIRIDSCAALGGNSGLLSTGRDCDRTVYNPSTASNIITKVKEGDVIHYQTHHGNQGNSSYDSADTAICVNGKLSVVNSVGHN